MWTYPTAVGIFSIKFIEGRFHPMFNGQDLGSYHSAEFALDDLVGGHTFSLPGGIDPTTIRLPRELAGWSHSKTSNR